MKRWLTLLVGLMLLCSTHALAEGGDTLSVGSQSEAVRTVQEQLTRLGYYEGALTGHYGEGTAAAVRAFQEDFGLTPSGAADASTQALLLETAYRPVAYGSSGEDVKRLQLRLAYLGYYTGKVNGYYLDSTVEAVSAFQKKMGVYPSGEADVDTCALLFGQEARTDTQSALKATVTATPEPTDSVDFVDGATPAPDSLPSGQTPFVRKLEYGSTGALVKQVQERLTELSYYGKNISGNYLGNTRNAVKRFQAQNGLTVDGIVGEQTWWVLFNSDSVVPPDATPKPTRAPDADAYFIVVDVNNQVTTVYCRDEAGEYTQVVRQMLCSTGTTRHPSDLGDWVLPGRKATWCYFPEWGSHARYWTKINSSIAFHSVIYNTVNTMDLSVSSYKNLGKRASHGCVRLTVADAKWIYDHVEQGTIVRVVDDLPADPELVASLKLPALNTKNMLPYATEAPTVEPAYVSGARPSQPLTELKKGDSSEEVWRLQKKLTELGYYSGKCSGTYLSGTQAAVKAFQKEHGLNGNGVATVETLSLLYQEELATVAPVPVATETPEPLGTPEPIGTPEAMATPEPTAAL